jgi:hypothetical protein
MLNLAIFVIFTFREESSCGSHTVLDISKSRFQQS